MAIGKDPKAENAAAISAECDRMTDTTVTTPPRALAGGIIFSIANPNGNESVFITDAALINYAPRAMNDGERVNWALERMPKLIAMALKKSSRLSVPELIVLDLAEFDDARDEAPAPCNQ